MNDQPTPTDDDLSLALDGEADAELLARIDASPEAQDRLEQLRAGSALVAGAAVPPLADDLVDGLIQTAIDTPIAPERPASKGRGGPAPWLVAAAVILLMAVGLTLVWAGRGTEDDQASAKFETVGNSISVESDEERSEAADSAFSETDQSGEASAGSASPQSTSGRHGEALANTDATATTSDLPLLFLGTYADGDDLRTATAASLADAWRLSGSIVSYNSKATAPSGSKTQEPGSAIDIPSTAAVERCADQLQVTLSLEDGPLQTGYADVDDRTVLVYEFAATSAADGAETTLIAAVGVDACDEVVLFER